jgi:hypothetical protein
VENLAAAGFSAQLLESLSLGDRVAVLRVLAYLNGALMHDRTAAAAAAVLVRGRDSAPP